MRNDEASGRSVKNEVVHARLSADLKGRLDAYANSRGSSTSAAVSDLLERALSEDASTTQLADQLAALSRRLDSLAKDCGLAAKRAGKASQASLGALALISWAAPDFLRFLANEALMRGQMLARVLGNPQAAEKVKVPASLGRFANAKAPEEIFRMAYSELGGKLSRDSRTSFLPAWASAVALFDVGELGLMGRDAQEWEALAVGEDARSMSVLAAKAGRAERNG